MNDVFKSIKVENVPLENRPRERLKQYSEKVLKTEELLAILLRCGTKKESVIDLARHLIDSYGSLKNLSQVSWQELREIHGIGDVKAVELKAMFELSYRLHSELNNQQIFKITNAYDVVNILAEKFDQKEQEEFWVLCLDVKNHVIDKFMITRGLVDCSLVHPREVFKYAVRVGASRIIIAHNHPSGDLTPSQADFEVTKLLKQSGEILKITLLDHIIVTNSFQQINKKIKYYSFAENGKI